VKLLLSTLIILLPIASNAQDYVLKISIPQGPGLTRLGQLCDWLREDPEISKPTMTNQECGERFFLRGAFEFNHQKKLRELKTEGRVALWDEDAAFWLDLPMPTDGGTPTPTVSPTTSPTATPTVTPTP